MIAPSDRIALAPGVRLDRDGLHDPVRDATFPLNDSARVVISAHTVGEAAAALTRAYTVAADRAWTDATAFCAELNDRLLLDVAPRGGSLRFAIRWLRVACLLLPLRVVPRVPARRKHVDTTAMLALLRTGSRALLGPGGVFAAMAGFGALLVARQPVLALAVAMSVGVGIVTHELGHLVLLRGVPACVVIRGLRVSVLHRRVEPRREVRIALAGPVAGILLAVVALLAVELFPSPELAAVALLEAGQLLGLTVLTHDGRRACAVC